MQAETVFITKTEKKKLNKIELFNGEKCKNKL